MQNNRKSKVVNPKAQYREALLAVMIFVIAINTLIIVYSLFFLDEVSPPSSTGYFVIGVTEMLFIVSIWYFSIKSSHRMAGPVYAFGRELKKLQHGEIALEIRLRPTDDFLETAETINTSLTHIRRIIDDLKTQVDNFDSPPSPEQLSILKSTLNKLKT